MNIIKLKLTGTRPLLMHADIFADPLNPLTKAHKSLTGKRKKTDEDHELIARSEWRGGLYFDDEIGPYVPGINIESSLVAGGKLSKLGTQMKRSIEIVDERCRLEYEGPRTVGGLWEKGFYDARSVKVSSARITRYRPMFKKWHLLCSVAFDKESIDHGQIVKSFNDAGMYCGLGEMNDDARKRHIDAHIKMSGLQSLTQRERRDVFALFDQQSTAQGRRGG